MAEISTDPERALDRAEEAHTLIGGFIVRCSALDYRTGQLIARWFCVGDKQNYLSYVLHSMDFQRRRQVIDERLTRYHAEPEALRAAMTESALIFERRDLVANGLLSTLSDGRYCIKSFAGARFLSEPGERDILPVDTLPEWSQRATQLAERLVKLGDQLAGIERPTRLVPSNESPHQ